MERPKRRSANMTTDHEFAVVASRTDIQKVFVAIELSKSTWVVAIQPPAVDKVSLFRIAGGEDVALAETGESFHELAVRREREASTPGPPQGESQAYDVGKH